MAGVKVVQGGSAVLSCPATGSQPISYSWLVRGSPIRPGARYQINSNSGSLTIRNVQIFDTGSYECSAQNEVATARQSVSLFVQCN